MSHTPLARPSALAFADIPAGYTPVAGVVRYAAGKLEKYNGSAWEEVGAGGGAVSPATSWAIGSSTINAAAHAIAYGNGVFVVSNGSTAVSVSTDSKNWTSMSVGGGNYKAVCFGNGYFIALSTDYMAISVDGLSWEYSNITAALNALDWVSIAYGNYLGASRFVAVASTGEIAYSNDGMAWTLATPPAGTFAWTSVTWGARASGNGTFVAVDSTGKVAESADGISWTQRTSALAIGLSSVCSGNGLFVAVSDANSAAACVMTSPDAIAWTSQTAHQRAWKCVCYGQGVYVAVANSGTGDRIMTSPDGITWTLRTSPADNSWTAAVFGNGMFVAAAASGTNDRFMTSGSPERSNAQVQDHSHPLEKIDDTVHALNLVGADLGYTNAPTPGTYTPAGTPPSGLPAVRIPVLDFADGAVDQFCAWEIGSFFKNYSGQKLRVDIVWTSTVTTGNVRFVVSAASYASGADITTKVFDSKTAGALAAPASSMLTTKTTILVERVWFDDIDAGDNVIFLLGRTPTDGGDTMVGTARVLSVTLSWR